jgi:hypothetical protein
MYMATSSSHTKQRTYPACVAQRMKVHIIESCRGFGIPVILKSSISTYHANYLHGKLLQLHLVEKLSAMRYRTKGRDAIRDYGGNHQWL